MVETHGEPPDPAATRLVLEGWDHLKRQRPLAAWASFHRALGVDPGSRAAAEAVETLENAVDLPAAARAAYRFRAVVTAEDSGPIADLDQAADYYGRLAARNPGDANLWYNRALCLAWTGANREAISCLERVVELEAGTHPESATAAWLLAEVLRPGAGAEDLADDLQYAVAVPWRDDQTPELLAEFPELEPAPLAAPAGLETPELKVYSWFGGRGSSTDDPPLHVRELLANVFVGRGRLRLSSPRLDSLERAFEPLARRFELASDSCPREARPLPIAFLDAALWTFRVPEGLEPDQAETLHRERVEHAFEDEWIHGPRRGLAGESPLRAAHGDAVQRARLAALVRFREQLALRPGAGALYHGYPFDRLRRRLGLALDAAESVDPADLSCASPAELDALDPDALDLAGLNEAVASAAGLRDDARTARLCARWLDRATRAPEAERPRGVDPAAFVAPLVRTAIGLRDPDRALHVLEQARPLVRASDQPTLDLWSAEVLARSGRPEEALRRYLALIADDQASAVAALDAALDLLECGHQAEADELLTIAARLGREQHRPWIERATRRIRARLT